MARPQFVAELFRTQEDDHDLWVQQTNAEGHTLQYDALTILRMVKVPNSLTGNRQTGAQLRGEIPGRPGLNSGNRSDGHPIASQRCHVPIRDYRPELAGLAQSIQKSPYSDRPARVRTGSPARTAAQMYHPTTAPPSRLVSSGLLGIAGDVLVAAGVNMAVEHAFHQWIHSSAQQPAASRTTEESQSSADTSSGHETAPAVQQPPADFTSADVSGPSDNASGSIDIAADAQPNPAVQPGVSFHGHSEALSKSSQTEPAVVVDCPSDTAEKYIGEIEVRIRHKGFGVGDSARGYALDHNRQRQVDKQSAFFSSDTKTRFMNVGPAERLANLSKDSEWFDVARMDHSHAGAVDRQVIFRNTATGREFTYEVPTNGAKWWKGGALPPKLVGGAYMPLDIPSVRPLGGLTNDDSPYPILGAAFENIVGTQGDDFMAPTEHTTWIGSNLFSRNIDGIQDRLRDISLAKK